MKMNKMPLRLSPITSARCGGVFALAIAALLIFASTPFAFEASISPTGALTLNAAEVELQDVLKRLARQGIAVRIDPAINFAVTADFTEKPIREALDLLLGQYNFALIWNKTTGPSDARERFVLKEIQIFEQGAEDRLQPLTFNPALPVVRDPDTGNLYVQGELLIRLHDKRRLGDLKDLVADVGGIIESKKPTNLFHVRLPGNVSVQAFLEKLEKLEIGDAEPNYAYRMTSPWGYSGHQIVAPELPKTASAGKGPAVAVYDSGLSPQLHQERYIAGAFNALDPEAPVADTQGHGTQMVLVASGTVDPLGADAGGDNTIPVVAIQGFDENGMTSNASVIEGVRRAMESGARVLSLSWHALTESRFLKSYLTEAAHKGLIIVAAAGNEPTGKAVYPAAYPDVIGVGALQADGKDWTQSNFGDFVEVKAPGFANLPVGYNGPPGIYAGTSIATAHVANQIAVYLSDHPKATRKQIVDHLNSGQKQE